MKTKKGFTLVELLVVIAIIGLLATIAFISLNSARGKARDAKRVSDVRQVMAALELYYSDQGGYPYDGTAAVAFVALSTIAAPMTNYIGSLPTAPTPYDSAACSANNDYVYETAVDRSLASDCAAASITCTFYRLRFCIGAATGGLVAGIHYGSPDGIQ